MADLRSALDESGSLGIPLDPRFVPVGSQEVSGSELAGLLERLSGDTVDESDLEIAYRLHLDIDVQRRLTGKESEILKHLSNQKSVNFYTDGNGLDLLRKALPEIEIT